MTSTKTFVSVFGGLLALASLAGVANAQTAVNIGGSSAARNFMSDVPLNLCDAATPPTATHYTSANNNLHTWTCTRLGSPIIIRYSATSSSDGITKLQVPTGDPASIMPFLDHTLTTGCSASVVVTRPSDGKQYNNVTGCSNTNITNLPVIMGAADVGGSSFHQVGPFGTSVSPLDDSVLNVVQVATVPFSLYVGKGVVKLDAAGTSPAGPITTLSRLEVEQILSGSVADWGRLGYGTVTDAAPTVLEATSPITLCMRNAGSGTKAALKETVLINTTEYSSIATGTKVFSSSTSGVLTCLASNRRAIGYMDADQEVSFLPGGANVGLAYVVRLDGFLAHDPSLTDAKRDLKCGRYEYWAGERLNRRTTSEGAAIDALAQAFIDNASTGATIALLPTGAYWAAAGDMSVFKNADAGPINWKAGTHPECR